MELDYSLRSVHHVGLATNYFPFDNWPCLALGEPFSLANAITLVELSRLVYRQEADEIGDQFDGLSRQAVLDRVGMQELAIVNNIETSGFASLIGAKDRQGQPCSILVFRGSNEFDDWKHNFMAYQTEAFDGGRVHAGFLRVLVAIWKDLLNLLKQQTGPLFITGHSMGAALATLAAARLLENGQAVEACYVFGSPKVGDQLFEKKLKSCNFHRIENGFDIVTSVPVDLPGFNYIAAGVGHYIDHQGVLYNNISAEEIADQRKLVEEWPQSWHELPDWSQSFKIMQGEWTSLICDHAPSNYLVRLHRCWESSQS